MDSESCEMAQKGLETIMQGKTVLIIVHRLTTIKDADTIYVIENGRTSQFGTYDELFEKSGLYKYNV